MSIPSSRVDELLKNLEDEHCEFKEARTSFSYTELGKYVSAMSNEGGGTILLGVSDKRPRRVVGSSAFQNLEAVRRKLLGHTRIGVRVDECLHPHGRVVIVDVSPRPSGNAVSFEGQYWQRIGDSLVPLRPERLRSFFMEIPRDFSAEVCPQLQMADLAPEAIEDFKQRWINKSDDQSVRARLTSLSHEQILHDCGARIWGGLTWAALILFGKAEAVHRLLPQAEFIFEFRSNQRSGPAQSRIEFRKGFFLWYDQLWDTVNLRNDSQHYQDGLFNIEVATFAEKPVREAILNAVSHRDYMLGGSVFIRQFPRQLKIESPGGLPLGVTLDNILERSHARNRCIAEIFARCGLVERSGQGMNLIFEESVQHSKQIPDFTGTDDYLVSITLHGLVQDPYFIKFMEKINSETQKLLNTKDFLILDLIRRNKTLQNNQQNRARELTELGVLESIGRKKWILSRRYYDMTGERGKYTRKRGLDREFKKGLILKHIRNNAATGSVMTEFLQILPGHSRFQIYELLKSLVKDHHIYSSGTRRAAKWYPSSPQ